MERDEPPDGVEFLDVGPDRVTPVARRRWVGVVAAAVVAAGLVVAIMATRHHPAHEASASASASASSSASSSAASSSGATIAPEPASPTRPPVTVTRFGHALLDEAGGWDLFGRGDQVMVRLDVARGVLVRTVVPALNSSGPVSFVPVAGQALIRPIDLVPGYTVPDSRPTRSLPGELSTGGGPVFPGPDANHVWTAADSSGSILVSTTLDGRPAAARLVLPKGTSPLSAVPDGHGDLLVRAPGGVYDVRPDGQRRISTGSLLAVGPTGWLVAECTGTQQCTAELVDRATGARRAVGRTTRTTGPVGTISPDGRTAAVYASGRTDLPTAYLLDLRSGSRRPIALRIDPLVTDGTLAWAPDSRWLLAIDSGGRVRAVDRGTGRARILLAGLPPLQQLAVRPAADHPTGRS